MFNHTKPLSGDIALGGQASLFSGFYITCWTLYVGVETSCFRWRAAAEPHGDQCHQTSFTSVCLWRPWYALTCAPFFLCILSYFNDTSSTAQGGGGSFKNRKPIGEVGCCESGMAERIHWWTERCLRSPTLSRSFSDYLPTYLLSSMYLSIYRSISLSLSSNYLSIYLSIHPSIYLI